MKAITYQRIFNGGDRGTICYQTGGYSDEDMARVSVLSLADRGVMSIRFHIEDSSSLFITRQSVTRMWPDGTVVVQWHQKHPVDTRCHHPSCVARGRCTYSNKVAAR